MPQGIGNWHVTKSVPLSLKDRMPPGSGGRVAGMHHCIPAPQEPYMLVSSHTAQALVNAPIKIRGCLIGLGVNLDVTETEPATEMTSVAQAAPATVLTTAPTFLRRLLRRLADR